MGPEGPDTASAKTNGAEIEHLLRHCKMRHKKTYASVLHLHFTSSRSICSVRTAVPDPVVSPDPSDTAHRSRAMDSHVCFVVACSLTRHSGNRFFHLFVFVSRVCVCVCV